MVRSRDAEEATRLFASGDAHVLLLANGSECGFSTGAGHIARLLLDNVAVAWNRSDGEDGARLRSSLIEAQHPFLDAAERIAPPDPIAGGPSGEIFAAIVHSTGATLAWIGRAEATHLRGRRVLSKTRGHTLANQLLANDQLTAEEVSKLDLPNVGVRSVERTSLTAATLEPCHGTILAERGDVLVIASAALLAGVAAEEMIELVEKPDAAACAEGLVDVAMSRGCSPSAAAVVCRW
jgi:serine/threonine protein phosphatase PrpC